MRTGRCLKRWAPDSGDGRSDYGNPYLFTGRQVDYLDSGSLRIQYNRNRYYDQYTGRWTTQDPLGITPNAPWPNRLIPINQYQGAVNLYEWAMSQPDRVLDPYGLLAIPGFKKCSPWKNDGDAYEDKRIEYGCREVSPGSMPPSLPVVDLIAEGIALVTRPIVVCDLPMDRSAFGPDSTCMCVWRIKRPCKRTCCRKYWAPKDEGWIDDYFWWQCVSEKGWAEKRHLTVGFESTYGMSYQDTYDYFKIKCRCPAPSHSRGWQARLNKKQCK